MPLLTIHGPVDSDDVSELGRQVRQAFVDGNRLVVIDLLAVPATGPQIPSELGAALRNASTGEVRLAVVTADRRLHGALELSGIDGLELPSTIDAALAVPRSSPAVPADPAGVALSLADRAAGGASQGA